LFVNLAIQYCNR